MGWIGEAKSLGDLFHANCERFGPKAAFQWRTKAGVESLSFSQAHERVRGYASGLVEAGLQRGDRLVLVCETCLDWAMVDWACQTLGIVLVPVFPSLPADQAGYIAQDCGAALVVAQDDKEAAKFEGFRTVLVSALASSPASLSVEDWRARAAEVNREDVATWIYTSGTTGQPKGAMLRHAGFLDLSDSVRDAYGIDERDTFLSFLPLSHVFERYAGHFLPFSVGATVAYAGSLASLMTDMATMRPTIMCAVPRFFENMRQKILDNAEGQKPVQRWMFSLALSQGAAKSKGGFAPLFGLTDKLVGSKVRAKTGGRIRFFVSGGAALAPTVGVFFNSVGLKILQGYGLTETTAATCLNLPDDNRPWTVGPPIPCVEVRLAEDGEILVRGSTVMVGYHNLTEATAEALDSEGWFKTGDIGEFEGAFLKITDRKKDILVLANGKNIAPQKLESKLKESQWIAEAVVFGDGMEHCAAMIVPDPERLQGWLKQHGGGTLQEAVAREDVRAMLKAEVDAANRSLADFERIKRHVLVGATFSVETGELTPSLKVKRKFVREKYAAELEPILKPRSD